VNLLKTLTFQAQDEDVNLKELGKTISNAVIPFLGSLRARIKDERVAGLSAQTLVHDITVNILL
jgi:hypothetical protein